MSNQSVLDFGLALKSLRSALGLSQLALASRLGSTQRHISFLETGRSKATLVFLQRLSTELHLSAAQKGALYEASGYQNPYPTRDLNAPEMVEALNIIESQLLKNWPFPAFALDQDWHVLRANSPARTMFAAFGITLDQGPANLLALVLSESFRNAILNWESASMGMYFRLQRAAARTPLVADAFKAARQAGWFDHIPDQIRAEVHTPVISPVHLALPDGTSMSVAPFVGQLANSHDARLEEIEIELMVPLDETTQSKLHTLSK